MNRPNIIGIRATEAKAITLCALTNEENRTMEYAVVEAPDGGFAVAHRDFAFDDLGIDEVKAYIFRTNDLGNRSIYCVGITA